MDNILSEFIAKTSCEPGFARDLLNHHNWNLGQSLRSYYDMKDMSNGRTNGTSEDDGGHVSTNGATAEFSSPTTPTHPKHNNNNNNVDGHGNHQTISTTSASLLKESIANLMVSKFNSEPSLSSQSSDVCDSSGGATSGVATMTTSSTVSKVLSPSKLGNEILFNEKKLTRGISRASNNVNLVSKARNKFAQDFQTSSRGSRLLNVDGFLETPEFTFSLPDISIHDEEFREFLRKDLIEKSTLNSLQTAKRLNWWQDVCQCLYPLVTSGDGNCLLHAASLGMWGFHDRELTLRRALYILLSNSSYTRSFYRRWRWQTHFQNSKAGLTYSETEWESEWDNILKMASTEPRSKCPNGATSTSTERLDINGGKKEPNEYEEKLYTYESLEEIHIFALAHVLRRPIVVIADTMLKDSRGEAFFPIPFGGLYLPFECPDSCLMNSPLCLTYDAAHFSALVAMNSMDKSKPELPLAIPLMDVDHKILPLHFAIDPGEDTFVQKTTPVEKLFDTLAKSFVLTEQDKIELLKKYFDIITLAHIKENCVEVKKRSSETTSTSLAAGDRLKVPQTRAAAAATVEKSQTLPTNFGRKPNELTTTNSNDSSSSSASSSAGKSLVRKSSYLLQRPFVSFGRMSKRIKKNIGHLARKSASFRLSKGKDEEKSKEKDKSITANGTTKEKKETTTTTSPERVLEPVDVVVELVPPPPADDKESIINTDNSVFYCETYVFAARLQKDKRPFYYDDMIKNYLNTARARFLNEKRLAKAKLEMMPSVSNTSISSASSSVSSASELSSSSSSSSSSSVSASPSPTTTTNTTKPEAESKPASVLSCVSPNCSSPSSAVTNYLCTKCFDEQRQQMANFGNKTTETTVVKAPSKKVDQVFDVALKPKEETSSVKSSNVQSSTYPKDKSVNGHEDYDHHLEIDKIKHFNTFGDRLSSEFYVPNSL